VGWRGRRLAAWLKPARRAPFRCPNPSDADRQWSTHQTPRELQAHRSGPSRKR
jgi:hypothetical protein